MFTFVDGLTVVAELVGVGAVIGGSIAYIIVQVNRIEGLSKQVESLRKQLEAEHKRVSRANQHIDILTSWVNGEREATPQMGLEFGSQFEPIPNLDDN